ncbi:MAG: anti-sigma F factor [Clostridia bacterium]|nr:anti-sigma F factor [Clostridia bacterium]
MKILNEMKMEFLNKSENEAFARVVIASFASQLDPTLEEITDIKTAVSEAVTNAIIHGYENEVGYVRVECRLYDDNRVEVEVVDKGHGIDDVEKAMQPLYTSKPELERSGMGFTVMETFMDEIYVRSILGKGTNITMVKYIKDSKKNDSSE